MKNFNFLKTAVILMIAAFTLSSCHGSRSLSKNRKSSKSSKSSSNWNSRDNDDREDYSDRDSQTYDMRR